MTKKEYLSPVDWSHVRPIYKKLSDEFNVLTSPYAIYISERIKLMLDHLILGIDEVDQAIDQLESDAEREALMESILNFLGNTQTSWNPV